MMASGFFVLFDDIALLMDDIAVMGKVATKKTAGILGDDLAVNAEKASGFTPSRELPVLWVIVKGSLLNKVIILPFAFVLSAFASWIIIPILMLGGIYLAYEGVEKIYEYFAPHEHTEKANKIEVLTKEQILDAEKEKIKSAILTDFILSIEIVIIALSTVVVEPLIVQVIVVSFVSVLATIGVYGIVAMIIRMDDLGFRIITKAQQGGSQMFMGLGIFLVSALPKVIRSLNVIGTVAMLLVAGGIYVHNVHQIHDFIYILPTVIGELTIGLIVGTVALLFKKLINKFSTN